MYLCKLLTQIIIDCFLIIQPTPAPTTSQPTPPLPGLCSDGTGSCSTTDMTQCSCTNRRRTLLKGAESEHNYKQDLDFRLNLRRLAKKTPSPVDQPSPPPTSPPVAPTNPVRSQFLLWLCFLFSQKILTYITCLSNHLHLQPTGNPTNEPTLQVRL